MTDTPSFRRPTDPFARLAGIPTRWRGDILRAVNLLAPRHLGFIHAVLLVLAVLMLRLGIYTILAGGLAAFPQSACRWDCLWFGHLANFGYNVTPMISPPLNYAQANWADFPAFPGLVAGLMLATHQSFELCGLIVANLAFVGFVLLGTNYLAAVRPHIHESACIFFLMAFPFGFYFSIPYSESLYGLLAVGALLALERKKLMIAGVFMSALLVTRVTGVLLWPALAWIGLTPALHSWWAGRRRQALVQASQAMLPLAIAPLGLTLFMAYLYAHVGDALAFDHVQAGWHRQFENPIATLAKGFLAFDVKDAVLLRVSSQWLYATSGILGLALAVRLAWINRTVEAWFLGATVLLAASNGIICMQRYVWANPVAMLFLFDWFWAGRGRRFFPAVLLGLAAIQIYLIYCWYTGRTGLV